MNEATLIDLLPRLSGARPVGRCQWPAQRVHTDTRSLQPGDLFVALRGDTFDAHHFLSQAAQAGAVAAVAEHGLADAGLPGVEVPDSLLALGELAALWRARFHLPLIAVTGSNGKTTVTQMVASILRAAVGRDGEDALATRGNLNNHIGVPQTLLRLQRRHRLAVVELGMNHPGEIAGLAAMAQPTVALVNNAQREHQEFMGTVQAVARENGAVICALPADGVAVFPSDDAHTPVWRELAGARRVLSFSDTDAQADVTASATWQGLGWQVQLRTPAGETGLVLRVAGRHNVRNALAATACALAAGVPLADVVRGLEAFEPVQGRSRALALPTAAGVLTVVDDTYNANPDSVLAALDVLAALPAPRTLVLGDMGEVGEQALAFHTEVLAHAAALGLTRVFCTGTHMAAAVAAGAQGRHVAGMAELLPLVRDAVASGGSVLIKGSRFMKMERVVQDLQAHFEPRLKDPAVHPSHGATHAA
jgi:UDP-N-acetylmuramoyl-tripeptide--D-alanyl-D-alanine ligase